jgi:DNA replication protein DnaC
LQKEKFKDGYFTDMYGCVKCWDTGFLGETTVTGKVERCGCLKQRLINKHYELSSLGRVLKVENFSNFKPEYYPDVTDERYGMSPRAVMRRNYELCREFIAGFGTAGTNLYFYGKPGLGKTYLCNCVAKELLDAGRSVLYLTAPKLFKTVEELRFGRDGEAAYDLRERMEFIYSAELLIIDDLGSEFMTTVTSSEFFNILNTRLLEGKQMIFSSNLGLGELSEVYTDRVTSRIIGEFTLMLFIGEDIRGYKKYNGLK